MTTPARATRFSLSGFIAHELPTEKWLKWIRPTMRLRIRVQNRRFVSSPVTVEGEGQMDDGSFGLTSVGWSWGEQEQSSRPFLVGGDTFEIKVERRFLLWYKCICRTTQVTIDDSVHIGGPGSARALPLYDGDTRLPEGRIHIGKITFAVRSEFALSEDEPSSPHS